MIMVIFNADEAIDNVTCVAYTHADVATGCKIACFVGSLSHRLHVLFCYSRRTTVSRGYLIYSIHIRHGALMEMRCV
jgi:hypothetical protein